MPFPEHIAALLERFNVRADTKAALYDLYVSYGADALEEFGNLTDELGHPSGISPEDLGFLRAAVLRRFLDRCHPQWMKNVPTESLWHPREMMGRAAGLSMPFGRIGEGERTDFSSAVEAAALAAIGENQPIPSGVVMVSQNGHYGGRIDTVSFEVVVADQEQALALATSEGQQHTLPGSVGQTSGTIDPASTIALLWEIQPNVFKPEGTRNRAVSQIYRKHRNWHVVSLLIGVQWLRARNYRIFILRGEALRDAHEVNAAKPVGDRVPELHNRTVERVVSMIGEALEPPSPEDVQLLLSTDLMNTALRAAVEQDGAASAIWRLSPATVQ